MTDTRPTTETRNGDTKELEDARKQIQQDKGDSSRRPTQPSKAGRQATVLLQHEGHSSALEEHTTRRFVMVFAG
jgi:hypothetical protein